MTMKEYIKECLDNGAFVGWLCLITSLILMISSFLLPPKGIIDNSVIMAVGELFAFAVVFKLPAMVKSVKDGKSIKINKGDASIEVTSEK